MAKHFTSTIYLVTKLNGKIKVFLHKHKKLKIWLGVGGHVEQNENPLEALIREVREEIGCDVTLLPPPTKALLGSPDAIELPTPQLMFEFKISAYKDEPEHYHTDFVYFGTVLDPNRVKTSEEYNWFSEAELRKVENLQMATYKIAQKAYELGKKYL